MNLKNKFPKVSALMPIYNSNEAHLRKTIEGILNQTFQDFEFLILNDSPENTKLDEIVRSYSDKRIKYSKNDKNMGISASRNKLIDMAKSPYLAVVDHDDISLPERFAKEVDFLDHYQDVGVVSSNIWKIDARKTVFEPQYDFEIKCNLMKSCCVVHTASMIRKSVLKKNGIKYNEQYSPSEDYKMWSELVAFTDFYNIPEVLVKYRDGTGNTTHKQNKKMRLAKLKIVLENQQKYPDLYQMSDAFVKKIKNICFWGVPLLKIVEEQNKKRFLLLGIIPSFSVKTSIK